MSDLLENAIEEFDGHLSAYLNLCAALHIDPHDADSTEAMKRAASVIDAMGKALKPISAAAAGWFMKNYNASEVVASIRVDGKYFNITAGQLFDARVAMVLLDKTQADDRPSRFAEPERTS